VFGGNAGAVQIEVTACREFGGSIPHAVGVCCDIAGYDTVVAVARLVGDDIADLVERIVNDQGRVAEKIGWGDIVQTHYQQQRKD